MKRTPFVLLIACTALSLSAAAADDPKKRQDLTAVIALQGKPCGEVVSYAVQGDDDFIATCKDKNRYRVYVKDGRVIVEKK
jgi:hypothetical protein